MHVAETVRVLDEERRDAVVVSTMSAMALGPAVRELDFRLLGVMGAAASIGLGIAIGRPDRDIWVVDGDGSLLMQLGVLAAVADAAPARFVHILIDNGVYGVSGAQPLPGRRDWPKLASGAGYRAVTTCETAAELRHALAQGEPGPRMVVARCAPERPDYPAGAFAFDASGEGARLRRALVATSCTERP
jgi:thiamine pyrophosphate-dependent acetolactate synthase large subunit-like protein